MSKLNVVADTLRGLGRIPVEDVLPHGAAIHLYETTLREFPNLPAPELSGPPPARKVYPKGHEREGYGIGPQWYDRIGTPYEANGVRGFLDDVPMSKSLPHLTVLQHQGIYHAHQVIQSRVDLLNKKTGGTNPASDPATGHWFVGPDPENPAHYAPGVQGWEKALDTAASIVHKHLNPKQFK